jgi:hypothetical protein
MLKRTLLTLALLCLLTGILLAADDPLVGRWILNHAKSNFVGTQMKIEDLGANKFKITNRDVSNTITADGTDQAAQFGATVSIAPEGSNAWKTVIKRDGKVVSSMTHTLSPDGAIQTIKGINIKPDGSTSDFEVELKRIRSGSGWNCTWEEVKEKDASSHELDIEAYEGTGLTFKSPDYPDVVHMKFDGKDYREVSPEEASGGAFSGKRVDEHSLELTYRMKGQVVENRVYQVSPDGKTLTITTHQSGQAHDEVRVYDKL